MYLRYGSTGEPVRNLQQSLNMLPPTALPLLTVDGIFGGKTLGRVREFQGGNGLGVDGIVGPLTHNLMAGLIDRLANKNNPYDRNYRLPKRVNLYIAVVYLTSFLRPAADAGRDPGAIARNQLAKAKEFLEPYNIGIKEWPPGGENGRKNSYGREIADYFDDPIPRGDESYRRLRKDVNKQIQNEAPRYPFLVPIIFCEFEATGKAVTPHGSIVGVGSPACLISYRAEQVADKLCILHEMGHSALYPKAKHNATEGNLMHEVSGRTFLFRFQVEAFATAIFAAHEG